MSAINLNPQWLHRVAVCIGKTDKETHDLIEGWYNETIPLKTMELMLSKMAMENGKKLLFAPPKLN